MLSTADFRKGLKIEHKDEPYEIVDFQHVKMGRGGAIVRTRLRSLLSGATLEEVFRAGEKVESPSLEKKDMQYLYEQAHMYYFMDTETYEEITLTSAQIKEGRKFMKENIIVSILYYKGAPITVELPTFVELMVKDTEPGFKGDTAVGSSKPATLETGAVIRVPFHINIGDTIKVDTRTGQYIERVK